MVPAGNKAKRRENTREEQNKIAFNLAYYPVFQIVNFFLAELRLLLTPDVAHRAAFTNFSITGFKNDRSLIDHLVRAVLSKVDREGRSKPCRRGRNVLVRYVNQLMRYERFERNMLRNARQL